MKSMDTILDQIAGWTSMHGERVKEGRPGRESAWANRKYAEEEL
jgi:hypothetical protein